MNRQDGEDEYHVAVGGARRGHATRVRPASSISACSGPCCNADDEDRRGEIVLGYRCANCGMTLGCGYRHMIETGCDVRGRRPRSAPISRRPCSTCGPRRASRSGSPSSSPITRRRGVPAEELADRCTRTLERAEEDGIETLFAEQTEWLDVFWAATDIELDGDEQAQQAVRWNLFQLGQASARTHEQGIAAKGVSAGGYDGHYFWDTEVYVATVPRLHRPGRGAEADPLPVGDARRGPSPCPGDEPERCAVPVAHDQRRRGVGVLRRRHGAVPHQRGRGVRPRPLPRTRPATSTSSPTRVPRSSSRPPGCGPTSASTRATASQTFHIHGVTGPDEYTTVVNDNTVHERDGPLQPALRGAHGRGSSPSGTPTPSSTSCASPTSTSTRSTPGTPAADAMYIPYDDELGIHPQDESFLDLRTVGLGGHAGRQVPAAAPLPPAGHLPPPGAQAGRRGAGDVPPRRALHPEQKRRNFDYYDPITTGDSSLSACVQAIVAAEVGYDELALDYFHQSLYLDLCDITRQHRRRCARRVCGRCVGGDRARIRRNGGASATTSSSRRGCRSRGTG